MNILSLLVLLAIAGLPQAREVILSTGLGGWTHDQLWRQYTTYKAYSDMHIVTGSSVLAYFLSENGTLGVYSTSDPQWSAEEFQQSLKRDLNLKALPCLYCDATIGSCSNLNDRLEAMYKYQDKFIWSTIDTALRYRWDGYYVDFEPDGAVNGTKLTDFIITWGKALQNAGVTLNVWIGGPTQYNMNALLNASAVNLVTMDTYTNSYSSFINIATPLLTSMSDIKRLGFGLLTNYGSQFTNKSFGTSLYDDNDMVPIARWVSLVGIQPLSLWASNIPPEWYEPLLSYVKKGHLPDLPSSMLKID
jgi:hypothetical protein